MACIAPLTRHAARFPAGVANVLVVASAMQDARSTAALLGAIHGREAVRIHLLAIRQPATGYARSFLGSMDVEKLQDGAAREGLQPLRDALDAAGTPYRIHIEGGPWLETIVRCARELGCTRIVVGDNPRQPMHGLVLRHDRWRIQSFLRGESIECAVINREPEARAPRLALGPNTSHPR